MCRLKEAARLLLPLPFLALARVLPDASSAVAPVKNPAIGSRKCPQQEHRGINSATNLVPLSSTSRRSRRQSWGTAIRWIGTNAQASVNFFLI